MTNKYNMTLNYNGGGGGRKKINIKKIKRSL